MVLCFPGPHHGEVAVQSHGGFQTALPPALEKHHIPQEEQGAIFHCLERK